MSPENREQFESIVPTIANSEVRALLLSGMSLHNATEGSPLARTGFIDMMLDMQGEEPAWELFHEAPYNYCKNYFVPAGIAVPDASLKRGRVVTSYIISRLGDELGVGIAGAALDGSLRYPDISLQPVLGKLDGRRENSFVQRLGWLRALVVAGDNGVERATLATDRSRRTERTYALKQMTSGAFSRLVVNEEGKADDSDGSSALTRVRLKPAFQEPAGVLLGNFDAVMTPNGLEHFKRRALQIAGNPSLCAELMAKAKRDSTHKDHLFPVAEPKDASSPDHNK
jgi:hypothetical protein